MTHCWLLLGWLVLQNQSWKSTVSPVLSGVLSIWWDGIEGNKGLSSRSSSSAPANHECVGGWFRVRAAFVLSASGWTFCWGRQMVCSCADFSSGYYFYMQSSHPTGEQFVKPNFGDLGDLPPPSLSSVGLFKSFTVCSLSLLSDHGGSVPGFFLAYNGTTFVDCHSKGN